METKQHRTRVFKDPYHWPAWQVYYGPTWVGSGHTRAVANVAAQIAINHAASRCEQSVTPLGIIKIVARAFAAVPKFATMWTPGVLHLTHTQHRNITRGSNTTTHRDNERKVSWTWQPEAA